jgi:hypothetical protein
MYIYIIYSLGEFMTHWTLDMWSMDGFYLVPRKKIDFFYGE